MVYYAFDLLHLDGLDTLAAPLIGKLALIKHQRYAHAHQFKRANRSLRKLKTYLGRVIRDIERRLRVTRSRLPA